MIALLRKLLRFIRKEQRFVSRYERSHPHFFWYLGIDALLSVAIVLGAYEFFFEPAASPMLKHSGVMVMSSEELINHVKKNSVDVFWLGPVSGYQYTLDHQEAGIADLFYIRNGSDPSSANQYLLEVKTYRSQAIWDAHTHTILAIVGTKTLTVRKGLSITINPGSMKGVISTRDDKPEIVAIAYPKPQTLQAMIKDVESLRLIE